MRQVPAGQLVLSATDLSNFLNCRHRTALDLSEARGRRKHPHFHDPVLDALFARGLAHERQYVDTLKAGGRAVVELGGIEERHEAVAATLEAMQRGAEVVVQAAFEGASTAIGWYGRPDVLLKIHGASVFGDWRYEVADTKLARETRGGTMLQLGLYSHLLAEIQGVSPEHFYVVSPDRLTPVRQYRVADYAAYFRLIKAGLEAFVQDDDDERPLQMHYPEPVEHCHVCPWTTACTQTRRNDNHLSLVAGISRLQRRELEPRSVATLTKLACMAVPLAFKPKRSAPVTHIPPGGRSPGSGIPVQLEPAERGDVPRPLRGGHRREPPLVHARLPDTTADEARQCSVSVSRAGAACRGRRLGDLTRLARTAASDRSAFRLLATLRRRCYRRRACGFLIALPGRMSARDPCIGRGIC